MYLMLAIAVQPSGRSRMAYTGPAVEVLDELDITFRQRQGR